MKMVHIFIYFYALFRWSEYPPRIAAPVTSYQLPSPRTSYQVTKPAQSPPPTCSNTKEYGARIKCACRWRRLRGLGIFRLGIMVSRHGEGMDGRIDVERITNVIAPMNPDLVALQEVDRNCTRSGNQDIAAVDKRHKADYRSLPIPAAWRM